AHRKRKWDITADDEQPNKRSHDGGSLPPPPPPPLSPPPPPPPLSHNDDPNGNAGRSSSGDAAEQALEKATAAANRILEALSRANSVAAAVGVGGSPSGDATTGEKGMMVVKGNGPPSEAFSHDVPINDIKNRYLLTKGATQTEIKRDTGADVTTRGRYYPNTELASGGEPPLYLHVSAATQESLDAALKAIDELINSVPPTFEDRRPSAGMPMMDRGPPPPMRPMLQEKVYVGIEPDRMFNVRAKLVGPQGAFVKHIQQETQTRVQLKGRGSGYIEQMTGREEDDALHIHVSYVCSCDAVKL
ncbi:hypothetical protein HKX48_002497, partial [Thoreauomyces humboldtii]